MSTITTINSGDLISGSRTDINNNFTALNTDKIETSVLDTDTSLTANSDSKIATQKAVKAYVDSGGNPNASTTQKGLVEEATSAEMIAGTGTGGTGARLFLNPTLVAETGADKIVKTKSTGLLDSSILPSAGFKAGYTTYNTSTASGTQTIAHGLGATPTFVKINAKVDAKGNVISLADTIYFNSTQSSSYAICGASAGDTVAGNTFLLGENTGFDYVTGVVTVDGTNISIAWTKAGSMTGTAYLLWEVK